MYMNEHPKFLHEVFLTLPSWLFWPVGKAVISLVLTAQFQLLTVLLLRMTIVESEVSHEATMAKNDMSTEIPAYLVRQTRTPR